MVGHAGGRANAKLAVSVCSTYWGAQIKWPESSDQCSHCTLPPLSILLLSIIYPEINILYEYFLQRALLAQFLLNTENFQTFHKFFHFYDAENEPLSEYISYYEKLNYDERHTDASHNRARRSVTKDPYVFLKFRAHNRPFHIRLKRDLVTFSDNLVVSIAFHKFCHFQRPKCNSIRPILLHSNHFACGCVFRLIRHKANFHRWTRRTYIMVRCWVNRAAMSLAR